jgi:hypothetical protein
MGTAEWQKLQVSRVPSDDGLQCVGVKREQAHIKQLTLVLCVELSSCVYYYDTTC